MAKLVFALILAFSFFTAAIPSGTDPRIPDDVLVLLNKYSCNSCHAVDKKMIGPSWQDIAAKGYSKKRIADLVSKPEPNNWPGYIAMTPQPTVPKADLMKIATWLVALK